MIDEMGQDWHGFIEGLHNLAPVTVDCNMSGIID
jgi:hypothetical protein